MIIFVADLRRAKMCMRGSKEFASRNGIDWQDFLKNGIDAELLRATDDKMALLVIESAEQWRAEKSRSQDTNITPL